MTVLSLVNASASPEVQMNEAIQAIDPLVVFSYDQSNSGGLNVHLRGGMWDGIDLANQIVAVTANATNYIVANRATGVVSASTATTNWNDYPSYVRLHLAVAGATTLTSIKDWRVSANGVFAINQIEIEDQIVNGVVDKAPSQNAVFDALALKVNLAGDQTLTGIKTFEHVIVGNAGTESTGIDINGAEYQSTFKVTDINGTHLAQSIWHKHSTSIAPLQLFARSNSNDNTHANVTNSMPLAQRYAAGYAGSNYKLFGYDEFLVSSTGTVSNTSAPAAYKLWLTPDGSLAPVNVFSATAMAVTTGVIFNGATPTEIGYLSGVTSAIQTQLNARVLTSSVGTANGVCELDSNSLVPTNRLPSYVDDVLEYANLAGFPVTGETGKIYVAIDTNKQYRWSGSVYVQITSGAVDSVFGRTGLVVAATNDYTWAQINKATSSIADITTKSHTLLTDIGTRTHAQLESDIAAKITNPTWVAGRVMFHGASGVSDSSALTFSGNTLNINAVTTETCALQVGNGRSGNGISHIDLVGDATYTDFGLRLIRDSGGANTNSWLIHRGTGGLRMQTQDSGLFAVRIGSTDRVTVNSGSTLFSQSSSSTNESFVNNNSTVSSSNTGQVSYYSVFANTAAASYNTNILAHYNSLQGTFGAGSTVTYQIGCYMQANLTGATYNRAFQGDIPSSGTNNHNLYMGGTALNYLLGNTGIGILPTTTEKLLVRGSTSDLNATALRVENFGGTGLFSVRNDGQVSIGTNTLALSANATVGGTNTGDQTSIAGITGTLAQFNTACTDDNFAYLGQANSFTAAQLVTVTSAGAKTTPLSLRNNSNTASTEVCLDFDSTGNGAGVRSSQISATTTGTSQTTLDFATSNGSTPTKYMRMTTTGSILVGSGVGALSAAVANPDQSSANLQIHGSGANEIGVFKWGANNDASIFSYHKSRGVLGAHSDVLVGDTLFDFRTYASKDGAFRRVGQFRAVAQTTSTNIVPTRYELISMDSSGVLQTHQTWGDSSRVGSSLFGTVLSNGTMVFPKTQGAWVKVDTANPRSPWRDITCELSVRTSGTAAPTNAAFRGGRCQALFFDTNDEIEISVHIPHDYVMGTNIYLHPHWGHNGTAISGSLVIDYYHTYSKGHNGDIFSAEKQLTQTLSGLNLTNTPRYSHRVDDIQLSTSGGSATLIDSSLLEPDGIIRITAVVSTIPTITGGSRNEPYIMNVDMHYMSTELGTVERTPSFWV